MMLRSGPTGSLTRSILCSIPPKNCRIANITGAKARLSSIQRIPKIQRPLGQALIAHKAFGISNPKYASTETRNPSDHVDKKEEAELGRKKLENHPEEVSSVSSVHQVFHEKAEVEEEPDVDMLAGIKSDWRAIKQTFALQEVPRQAFAIGLAGVLPYLATSVSTLYLAWDINHASLTGAGFLLSESNAELLLHILEPIQIGYGAVIISFLGAIHWGLEFAKYGGVQTYGRYAFGVIAPAIAWPTLLLPVEYALITQFLTFNFLYSADHNAVRWGWAPHWYSSYRFVLTFVVGASIVISLIGRGQIADKVGRMPGPTDHIKALRDYQPQALLEEEREQVRRRAAEAEARERGEVGDDEEGDDDEEDEE